MMFSRVPRVSVVGFEAPVPTLGPDHVTTGQVLHTSSAIEAAAIVRSSSHTFYPEARAKDSLFKQNIEIAAQYVRDVLRPIFQPDPQSGNRIGKRAA